MKIKLKHCVKTLIWEAYPPDLPGTTPLGKGYTPQEAIGNLIMGLAAEKIIWEKHGGGFELDYETPCK